jgi:hypothetical protein
MRVEFVVIETNTWGRMYLKDVDVEVDNLKEFHLKISLIIF